MLCENHTKWINNPFQIPNGLEIPNIPNFIRHRVILDYSNLHTTDCGLLVWGTGTNVFFAYLVWVIKPYES